MTKCLLMQAFFYIFQKIYCIKRKGYDIIAAIKIYSENNREGVFYGNRYAFGFTFAYCSSA